MEFLTSQNVEVQQQIGIDVTLTFQEKMRKDQFMETLVDGGGELIYMQPKPRCRAPAKPYRCGGKTNRELAEQPV